MSQTANNLLPIYAVVGTDLPKRNKVLQRFASYVSEDLVDFNLEQLMVDSETTPQILVGALQALPFGDGMRIVILITQKGLRKELADVLSAYLEDPNPQCSIALVAESLDKRSKLYKRIQNLGPSSIISCEEEKPWKLPEYVQKLAGEYSASITTAAARQLIRRCGTNTQLLQTQLKTLSQLVGKGNSITDADVERYVAWTNPVKPWDLTNAVCERDVDLVLELLHHAENPSSLYMATIRSMAATFRELICRKSCVERGRPQSFAQELTRAYGKVKKDGGRSAYAPDWMLKNHSRWANNFTMAELLAGLKATVEVESGIKGDADDKDICFTQYLVTITKRS